MDLNVLLLEVAENVLDPVFHILHQGFLLLFGSEPLKQALRLVVDVILPAESGRLLSGALSRLNEADFPLQGFR